jgi:hypothetical protein
MEARNYCSLAVVALTLASSLCVCAQQSSAYPTRSTTANLSDRLPATFDRIGHAGIDAAPRVPMGSSEGGIGPCFPSTPLLT